jgi:very-short-patch-repair endonuclease
VTPLQVLEREQAKARREALECAMALQLRAVGLEPVREHRFHEVRKWRFDFAWPDDNVKVAIEVDGGTHARGRHNRATGYAEDCRKFAEAVCLGWRVIRVTGEHIRSGEAVRWAERLLKP